MDFEHDSPPHIGRDVTGNAVVAAVSRTLIAPPRQCSHILQQPPEEIGARVARPNRPDPPNRDYIAPTQGSSERYDGLARTQPVRVPEGQGREVLLHSKDFYLQCFALQQVSDGRH